jgi:two-component system NtrC family response regulator
MDSASTILVVEDNDLCREALSSVLRREGYRVISFRNGLEALAYLEVSPAPDLILLDMLMPGLDGWHFLQEVAPKPFSPILVMTSTILSTEWADSHGCAGFLRKPIEVEDLLAEVKRCLALAVHHLCGSRTDP